MNITLNEIDLERNRVCQDIMHEECILAALDVLRKHVASGQVAPSTTLGDLLRTLVSSRQPRDLKEITATVAQPAPEPPALPPTPPVERYIHPELKALAKGYGEDTKIVRWAISQMTHDFSLYHIAALLEQEGWALPMSNISVVLSRLKKGGEIEEIQSGQGPIPALFCKPELERPADFKPLDEDLKLSQECEKKLLAGKRTSIIMKSVRDGVFLTPAQVEELVHETTSPKE